MSQLKSLNTNIAGKNAKIKRTYKSMSKVKVYFKVVGYSLDMTKQVYESDELTAAKATKCFKVFTHTPEERAKLLSMRPAKYIYKLLRVQTSGYVGGIILSGSCEVLESITI